MNAPRGRLGRFLVALTSHLRVKLLLLVLAAVCWFFVHIGQEMEVEFNLPLDLALDLPAGRTLVSDPPTQIQTLIRGRGRNLLFFALFGQGVCRVEGGRGDRSVELSPQHVKLQGALDLSIVSFIPKQLQLDVDRLESRRVPLRLRGAIEPAEGHVLTRDPALEPERVKVTGPRSVLDTLSWIDTEELDLRRLKRDSEERVALVLPWPSLKLESDHVLLKVGVDKRAERRFSGIPLQVRHLPAPLSVRPRSLGLTIVGGEQALAALEKEQIEAILDGGQLRPDQDQAPCRIIVPEGFNWTNPDPALFRIVGRRAARPRPEPRDSLKPEDADSPPPTP